MPSALRLPTRALGAWLFTAVLLATPLPAQTTGGGTAAAAPTSASAASRAAVAAGDTVRGTVAVAGRALEVEGVVLGDAVALGGDVVVRRGGRVLGDATAVGGRVRLEGGSVAGDMRSFAAAPVRQRPVAEAPPSTLRSVKVAFGWFAILAVIGIGVLLFAEGTLGSVSETLERHFARSFWYGLLAQLALLPLLLLMVAALALTVVGILLVPFAVVAYLVAFAGLLTLGFLAVSRFTGGAFGAQAGGSARARHLGALLRGLAVYLVVWLVAAAFTWHPLVGAVLRAVAVAASWVAATLGLGAAIASRVEARRGATRKPLPMDPMVWQTPTPVTGVAAARRAKTAAK